MTKERFKELVLEGLEDLMRTPDDIWEATYPMARLQLGNEVVVVGIEEAADEG